ncbi:chromosome segregation ATPase-like protein [Synechococcus phage S-SRP02]|nr:chromosome segregation ATPase-like protein [Synechococcus phage S-SRP02]
MPAFNLAPIEDDSAFDPVVPTAPAAQAGGGNQAAKPAAQRRPATRADVNQRLEAAAGPLKPLAQFMNVLASPDTKAGIFVGPVNAISKLGNAVGDLVQRKPIDTKDAWVIPDKVTRALNPFRIGPNYGEVTPADEAGLQLGGAIGAEILGAATGTTLIRRLGQVAQVKRAAEAVKATRAVRGFAVAQRANPTLRTGVTATTRIGEALVGTTLAAPFIDQDGGNLANLGDAMGLRLPGRADENDNYLQKFGKGLLVEGIAFPLTVIGAASFVPALRKSMFNGGVSLLDDIADAELAPYMYRGTDAPQLPPAATQPQLPSVQMQAAADGSPISPAQINLDTPGGALPGTGVGTAALPPYQQGGALVPTTRNGSAIERYLDERTQIRQVEDQRQRLMAAGLIKQGEAGQLELNVSSGDPEVKAQLEQLAQQRGELLSQVPSVDEATGKQLQDQIAQIDQQMADLNLSGTTEQFLAPRGSRQMEIDLDTRPEIDTYLAQLDELSDAQLRNIHSRVWREVGAERNANELANTQQQIEGLNQRLAEINARQQAGEITPRGAKGQITKVQRQLEMAQSQLMAIQQRIAVPETTVGQQLEMTLQQQLGLDLSPDIPLPPLAEVTRTASEYGYRTPDDYRTALQAWPRELLRRLAMPDSSPEVAALVKARTGRRVWQAKKSDIIDALVEMSERRGRYLPPEAEQLQMPLTTNTAGVADAPLFDRPSDLTTSSPMNQLVDADGNAVVAPTVEFRPRGMDAQTRERLKAEILRRAIDNGEVQAPVTPIPDRPQEPAFFRQADFVDDLFSDETGQLAIAFNSDALPPYKAGGKNADALIDEMRLRFEYNLLDAKAMQAQKDALMAAYGWDRLSWEEKKRLGLMGRGVFRMSADELTNPVDVVRPPTPGFTPELPVTGERAPQPYRGEGSAQAADTPQFTPELKPKPDRKPAVYDNESVYVSMNGEPMVVPRDQVPKAEPATQSGRRSRAATTAEAKAAKQALADIQRERQAMAQQLEELRKKHQGGSC